MAEAQMAGHTVRGLLSTYSQRSSHGEYEVEQNLSEINETIYLIEALFPAWVVMLCMIQHSNIPYVSNNSKAVLGYTPEQLKNLSPEDYYRLIHPDDIGAVRQAFGRVKEISLTENLELSHYRFLFHYRLLRPDGKYTYVLDDKLAVQNHHNRYVFFTLFKDLSQERKFTQVLLEVHRYRADGGAEIEEYVPQAAQNPITPREKEILELMQKGLNSQQIGCSLSISVNTVKNHRHNLFRKANARNSLELLHYARHAKWL